MDKTKDTSECANGAKKASDSKGLLAIISNIVSRVWGSRFTRACFIAGVVATGIAVATNIYVAVLPELEAGNEPFRAGMLIGALVAFAGSALGGWSAGLAPSGPLRGRAEREKMRADWAERKLALAAAEAERARGAAKASNDLLAELFVEFGQHFVDKFGSDASFARPVARLRASLALIERIRSGQTVSPDDIETIRESGRELKPPVSPEMEAFEDFGGSIDRLEEEVVAIKEGRKS